MKKTNKLAHALLLLVEQDFIHNQDGTVSATHEADRVAIQVLLELGHVEKLGHNRYKLLWDTV